MKEYKLFYNLRHKENKTQEDKLLLKYRELLGTISEVLVDESKCHLTQEEALNKIRKYISENM